MKFSQVARFLCFRLTVYYGHGFSGVIKLKVESILLKVQLKISFSGQRCVIAGKAAVCTISIL